MTASQPVLRFPFCCRAFYSQQRASGADCEQRFSQCEDAVNCISCVGRVQIGKTGVLGWLVKGEIEPIRLKRESEDLSNYNIVVCSAFCGVCSNVCLWFVVSKFRLPPLGVRQFQVLYALYCAQGTLHDGRAVVVIAFQLHSS